MHKNHKQENAMPTKVEELPSYYKTQLEIAENGLHNVNMRDSRFIPLQVAWQCHIQALNRCWLLGFWGSCGCIFGFTLASLCSIDDKVQQQQREQQETPKYLRTTGMTRTAKTRNKSWLYGKHHCKYRPKQMEIQSLIRCYCAYSKGNMKRNRIARRTLRKLRANIR